MPSPFDRYLGSCVVVDVRATSLTYLGTLAEVSDHGLVLKDADVHDASQSRTPREVYVLESKRHGVKANRREVLIRLEEVVSMSKLEDVKEY